METTDHSPSERKATYSTAGDSKFVDKIRSNIKSDLIEITADKLENILLKHLDKLNIKRAWVPPLSLFLTALLATLTATFSNKFGIDGTVWQAVFVLLAITALGWLLFALFRLVVCWENSSLDNLIDKIKNAQKESRHTNPISISIPINNLWRLNHWGSNCANIVGDKIVFIGTSAPKGTDGSHIDLNNLLDLGKYYEISCFAKSVDNTDGMFQLWCHDNTGAQPSGANEQTPYKTPSTEGERIRLNFKTNFNKNIRIHLQYKPGKGQIEVSDVRINEIQS